MKEMFPIAALQVDLRFVGEKPARLHGGSAFGHSWSCRCREPQRESAARRAGEDMLDTSRY